MIYLDNAATTLHKPEVMINAVTDALYHLGNADRGGSEESLESSRVILNARMSLNQLINGTSPQQIVLTANATESLNIALKGLFNKGDHIITTEMEHNSVLRPIYELENLGIEVTIISADQNGEIDLNDINKSIKNNTKALVITHASNLTGTMNPLDKISEITTSNDIMLIVDGAQTVGAVPIDVQALNIDVLCFTGHKALMGPQGTGGMYVRKGLDVRPLKTGGTGIDTYNHNHPTDLPTALEAGTMNGHGIAGLNASTNYLLDYGIDKIEKEERELTKYFYDRVNEIESVKVYGNHETKRHAPIVTLNIRDIDSSTVSSELMERHTITTRSGGHCAPLMHKALGTDQQGAVRFSFSHFTKKEELDTAINAIRELAQEYN